MLGCPVNVVSNGQNFSIFASGHLEVAHFLAHGVGSFGTPFRVPECIVLLSRLLGQELSYDPAYGVAFCCCPDPLQSEKRR